MTFAPSELPVFVRKSDWVGFDLDGTLARTDNPGHFEPPYPIGEPISHMLALAKTLLRAGVTIKIFTARACDPARISFVHAWTEKHGLGRLEVTNAKDFDLIRFYDDRAATFVLDHTAIVTVLPELECPGCGTRMVAAPHQVTTAAELYDHCLRRCDECGIGFSNEHSPTQISRQRSNLPTAS